MPEELKPCPFCGSNFIFGGPFQIGRGGPLHYAYKCADCFAEGPICDTEEEAISAWNRRK